jgi:hypothetical protein
VTFIVGVSRRAFLIVLPRRYGRRAVMVGLAVLVAAVAAFFAVAPPLPGFAVAVGLAVAWCWWLDRHPNPSEDARPRLSSSRRDMRVLTDVSPRHTAHGTS